MTNETGVTRHLSGPAAAFMDEVADWLLATRDPRLSLSGQRATIRDVPACCADFCAFMAQLAEAGKDPKDWRMFVKGPDLQ